MDLLRFACFFAVRSWLVADCHEFIRLPPCIVKGPSSSILFRTGETIELPCSATGVPAPEYEWLKNGRILELNSRNIRRLSSGDGAVQLAEAALLDEGFYQCRASNQFGSAVSNVSLVRRAFLDSLGSTVVENRTATEGQSLRIEFVSMPSYPKPQTRWASSDNVGTSESTSADIARSKRIQWDEHGNLYFAHVLPEDELGSRIYKGVSYNPRVDISVGGSYTRVKVDRVPGGIKPIRPRILFSSDAETTGLEGENITLRCFFEGYPVPDVHWTGPNRIPSVRFTRGNFDTELKIFGLRQDHEGDYTCTGSNGIGGTVSPASHTIRLTVEAVPVFKDSYRGPRNVNATEGDDVTFQCNPYADPKANVSWMINGQPPDVARRSGHISFSRDGHNLTIRSVCRDCSDREPDLMVIQCNASNEHGHTFAAGYLNVLRKTTVALQTTNREVIIDKESRQQVVVFQCLPLSDPSTPVALSWFRMVDNHLHPVHSTSSVVVGNGTLTISAGNDTRDWTKHEGRYKCVADNGYSKAEEVVEIHVNTEDREILPRTASVLDLWWIFLVIACLLLFLILILICYICIFCNRGDKYDVDGKERKNGNDPVKELDASGFHDYQRREIEPFKGSQNLLGSSTRLYGDDASDAGDHGGKFLENGSYRSTSYTDANDRQIKGRNEFV